VVRNLRKNFIHKSCGFLLNNSVDNISKTALYAF
jgi:hypothetical protein